MLRLTTLLTLSILLFSAIRASIRAEGARRELAVAAASNLSQVFGLIGPEFEKLTAIHPVFSFGSTARLTQQIESGAPWDIFAAADTDHVEQLDRKGLLSPGSRAVYATGILALWIPSGNNRQTRMEDLTSTSFRVIAMAKPELAPYGVAARETLRNLGIWSKVESKIVYAENIGMAKQYGETRNADAVFTAYALLATNGAGVVIPVPETLHQPIRQALGIIRATRNQAFARQFADFLLTGKGHQILLQHGYR